MLSALEGPLSALGLGLLPTLRRLSKIPSDRMLRDLGNYTAEYVALFEKSLGGGIPATRFLWSSANHHIARLRAAADLLRLLASAELGRTRVLLLGHSHGGQVLALLTQLVYPAKTAPALWAALGEIGEPLEELMELARKVARARLDVATFGMPPRYGFATGPRCRAMHVVNHRGEEPRASSLGGVLYTEGGDYVQQWGIAGSDLPPATAKEREVAARLDALLGAGSDVKAWLQHVRHRARVSQHGFSYLVDYGDRGVGGMPNFLGTCFGHGVYTTYDAMLFNAHLLAAHFYR
jgi:pimeloyl-ACP methyl ester carboxylesterase